MTSLDHLDAQGNHERGIEAPRITEDDFMLSGSEHVALGRQTERLAAEIRKSLPQGAAVSFRLIVDIRYDSEGKKVHVEQHECSIQTGIENGPGVLGLSHGASCPRDAADAAMADVRKDLLRHSVARGERGAA